MGASLLTSFSPKIPTLRTNSIFQGAIYLIIPKEMREKESAVICGTLPLLLKPSNLSPYYWQVPPSQI